MSGHHYAVFVVVWVLIAVVFYIFLCTVFGAAHGAIRAWMAIRKRRRT